MSYHHTTYFSLIIGAGAAGLAAAHALQAAGKNILVLEARERIGGRIHTDYNLADFPLELGAEFIHGDHAPTYDLLRRANMGVIPVERKKKLWWALPNQAAFPLGVHSPELQALVERIWSDAAGLSHARLDTDMSLADYLRKKGYKADQLAVADVLLAQTCCATLDGLSCYDLIREAQVDRAGEGEARIAVGYSSLLKWYSQAIPIQLNSAVVEIQWGRGGVSVITQDHRVYHAKNCIVTLPVSLLQQRMIHFEPVLPRQKQWAIDAFHFAAATKLIYRFRQRFWDADLTYLCHPGTAARWWTPSYGRQGAVIAAYLTDRRAWRVDQLPEAQALGLGLLELSKLLAVPMEALDRACTLAKRVAWAADPWTRGGYASLSPHKSEARPLLAQPEGNLLFFAGEATAYHSNPQTVHGALESGWRAAQECLERF
jgi:monoamine oxidase